MYKHFLSRFRYLAGLILLVFIGISAKAAEPIVHISPKPGWISAVKPYSQMPSLRTIEDGYYYELIEHQVEVEKQADYHHTIRKIISETGIQNGSEITVNFDPAYEQLSFHDITVWRDNKPQNRLKASAFKIVADEKELSDFIYQGTYSAVCILDDIRKGDRIEYSYTITGRNPIFNNKYCDFLYFQWYQTVAHQYTALIFSSGRNINMKLFNGTPKPVISETNGLKKYEWEGFQVKPALYDDNEPGWYDPREFAQISDYDNWSDVTKWALGINMAKTYVKGELADEIAKLKSISGDDKEKYFRNAVKTVQDEVRYMGIEIGPYSHRANDPEKVFARRYGDCKDKSLLLVSMLRADGIDANMVLVNSDGGDIGQYLPAHNIFDHAVVVAQLNNKPVWVDATIANQRGTGTNIYFPDYGKGLILKPDNTGLTKIPAPQTGKLISTENYLIKDEKSPVKFVVTTTYTLDQADKIRDRLASLGMAETEKDYLKYYSKIYNKITSADSVVVKDDEQKNVLITIEKYSIEDFFRKDSVPGTYYANLYANNIKEQLPEVTGETKTPVEVAYPFSEDYTIQVELPTGWDIKPEHYDLTRDSYKFSSDYSSSGDTLSLNYKFTYLKSFIPVDKLDEYKQDFKLLDEDKLSYSVSYTPDAPQEPPSDLNQWMVNMVLLIVLIAIVAGFFIYRQDTDEIVFSYGSNFIPLGGWLIVIAVLLCLTPIANIATMVNAGYFSMHRWNYFSKIANSGGHRALFTFEVFTYSILSVYAIFCSILLFNKRDIFPKYIIGFFATTVVLNVIDFITYVFILHSTPSQWYITICLRTIVFACIWIPYFMKSTRVEQTFIVPHPATNYTYEAKPEKIEGEDV